MTDSADRANDHPARARAVDALILGAIVVFHVATNLAFIAADPRTANLNELSHVMGPIEFLNGLANFEDKRAAYHVVFTAYPPGGALATLAFAFLGRAHDAAMMSQILPSVAILIGVYFLGRLLMSRAAGLVAAAFLAISPAACEASRQYLLEWPLTAAVVLTMFFAWRSDGYTKKRDAYLAGFCAGLAALSKQSFFIYLIGPIAVSLVPWIRAIGAPAPIEPAPRAPRREPRREPNPARIRRRGYPGYLARSFASRYRVAGERTPVLARRLPPGAPGMLLAGCGWIAASLLAAWLIYPHETRVDIASRFQAEAGGDFPFGMAILLVTAALIAGAGLFATFTSGPLGHAFGAAFCAASVASVWYLPQGLPSFFGYARQMQRYAESMPPGAQLGFYLSYMPPYYVGVIPYALALAALPVAILISAIRLAGTTDRAPRLVAGAYVLASVLVPFALVSFVPIRNEMNLVPVLPALALAQAWIFTRFLPARRANGEPPRPFNRALRAAGIAVFVAAFGIVAVSGILSATFYRNDDGSYRPLPIDDADGRVATRFFPRVFSMESYLVPRTHDWHIGVIVDHILAHTKAASPRVLSNDVAFDFSWIGFMYEFSLRRANVRVETQIDDNEDILADPRAPGHILGVDAIVYRVPWEKVLESAIDDYRDNDQIKRAYDYLIEAPPELREIYEDPVAFELPDGSDARVLMRRPGAPTLAAPAEIEYDEGRPE
ncbi:glycosyltransferase family 39 protein [bacterium]|nr:glycosyltransferase family 39 protein [bacterium]